MSIVNKIGFIGTGNLAASIVKGLWQNKSDYELYLYDVFQDKADALAEQFNAVSCTFPELISKSQILLLAVKPKDIKELLQELARYPLSGKLLIAVAAGIELAVYEQALPGTAVVRVMPNTSCAVLQAVSGMVKGQHVSDEQAAAAGRIFSAVGKVLWVTDSKINALTAVERERGLPIFYFLRKTDGASRGKLGLSKEEAVIPGKRNLVEPAGMLAEDSGHRRNWREAVTSPYGTTFAALTTFGMKGWRDL